MDNGTAYIIKSAKKLNVNSNITNHAIIIYKKAVIHPAIEETRIRDTNIALASLYIADRLYSKNPLDQNIYIYKFNISFATLRKCYIRICDALKIPRHKIVSPHHLKTSD